MNATAPASPPTRPSTTPPFMYRNTSWPSVVFTPAAVPSATNSVYSLSTDAPSSSAPAFARPVLVKLSEKPAVATVPSVVSSTSSSSTAASARPTVMLGSESRNVKALLISIVAPETSLSPSVSLSVSVRVRLIRPAGRDRESLGWPSASRCCSGCSWVRVTLPAASTETVNVGIPPATPVITPFSSTRTISRP